MKDSQNVASRSVTVHLFYRYIDILGSNNLLTSLSSNTTKCFIFLEWETKIHTRIWGRHDRTNLIAYFSFTCSNFETIKCIMLAV